MTKKISILFLLLLTSLWIYFLNSNFSIPYGNNILQTLAVITATFLFFNIVLDYLIDRNINSSKTRYSFKKASSIAHSIILILLLVTVWAKSVQALFVAYGLVAAGVALALQDIFKNFAAGILLMTKGIYQVGDRIEVDGNTGDIIDIGIFNTTILEIGNWISGDQATGRLINLPNGVILSKAVLNYTKDNAFIWDEITLPITHKSNFKKAKEMLLDETKKETQKYQNESDKEILKLSKKYYVEKKEARPDIFVEITDNWIALSVRYLVLARERRVVKSILYEKFLEKISVEKDINIASETLDVVGLHK